VAEDGKKDKETGRVAVHVNDCSPHKTGGLPKHVKFAVDAQYANKKYKSC
jgi:hypothetical protein